jgi:hypothetical protein
MGAKVSHGELPTSPGIMDSSNFTTHLEPLKRIGGGHRVDIFTPSSARETGAPGA